MSTTHPENDAPKAVQMALAKWGGNNPYGEPNWRIVLAQNCVAKRGGILHDLGDGNQSVFAVGPKGKIVESKIFDSVKSGVVELPKYACEPGWIVEKWFPASTWGTPEQWAAHKSEDGTRLLCEEYPSRGAYWMLIGPFEKIPELSDLENAISMHQESMRVQPTNYDAYFRQVMRDEEYARKMAKAKLVAELNYRRTNELVPVLKGTSLEAQKFRNQLSESTGDRSHLGAVHDA
jgi:hypothetical protein